MRFNEDTGMISLPHSVLLQGQGEVPKDSAEADTSESGRGLLSPAAKENVAKEVFTESKSLESRRTSGAADAIEAALSAGDITDLMQNKCKRLSSGSSVRRRVQVSVITRFLGDQAHKLGHELPRSHRDVAYRRTLTSSTMWILMRRERPSHN